MNHHILYYLLISLFFLETITAQEQGLPMDWANLNHFSHANHSLGDPAPGEKRVVFMGNSITEGWLLQDPSFFQKRPYINRGISGQTTHQMLVRFRQDVIDLKPAVVVILAGTNDIAQNMGPTTLEAIMDNIISMAELAKHHKIEVVLCAVLPAYDYNWRPGLEPAEKITGLNRLIERYCEESKIVFVDYHTPMADDRKGLKYEYGEDGVHPNRNGYKVMEPLVEEGIRKALQ
jgi:lysophospholipase L1-like esterase